MPATRALDAGARIPVGLKPGGRGVHSPLDRLRKAVGKEVGALDPACRMSNHESGPGSGRRGGKDRRSVERSLCYSNVEVA